MERMMNTFTDSINTKSLGMRDDYGLTFNGMATRTSSLDVNTDLFFQIGSSRNSDVTGAFSKAFQHNPDLAIRTALWARDIRGGAGERQTFRSLLLVMERTMDPDEFESVLAMVPELGRWDDILNCGTGRAQVYAIEMIRKALEAGDGLCAKWMPRKGKKAADIRRNLGWSPKFYRKTLVGLTKVVESQMCAKEWDAIEFGKVPSVAAARYQKAFSKNATDAYSKYREGLEAGTEKINAGAIYPYDVIKSLRANMNYGWRQDTTVSNKEVIIAQWNALPNMLGDDNILAMVDTSGSMGCPVAGNNNLSCMDVAVSLGLYIADKQEGAFKDTFLTFSGNPKLENLKGDIIEKFMSMIRSDWGMNTDLMKAMAKILSHAQTHRVPQEDMPKTLVILSDMEFDHCASGSFNLTAMEATKTLFRQAGYEMPNVVFWNLNARDGNVPVRFDEAGTALVSGFSPNILKSILSGEDMTPEAIMLATVMVDRYKIAA
jgi:hypothetical protein